MAVWHLVLLSQSHRMTTGIESHSTRKVVNGLWGQRRQWIVPGFWGTFGCFMIIRWWSGQSANLFISDVICVNLNDRLPFDRVTAIWLVCLMLGRQFIAWRIAKSCITRMHSSRMRTGRSLTVCQGGVSLPGVVSLPGGSPCRGVLPAMGGHSPCWRREFSLPGGVSLPGGSPCLGGLPAWGGCPCLGGLPARWGLPTQGGILARGVSLPGGGSPCQRPPPLWTESHTAVKTLP